MSSSAWSRPDSHGRVEEITMEKKTGMRRFGTMGSRRIQRIGGFEATKCVLLDSMLPAAVRQRNILCLSDMHLLPDERHYGRDAPEELLGLLQALPHHSVILLGDVFEALAPGVAENFSVRDSRRLQPILQELGSRRVAIVPGNHDLRIVNSILEYKPWRVHAGGFSLGRVIFIHGHESNQDDSHWAEQVGEWVVPVAGVLDQLGLSSQLSLVPNSEIASFYSSRGLYPIFGHTHRPCLKRTHANTGCFLRSQQSFLTLENGTLVLWREH